MGGEGEKREKLNDEVMMAGLLHLKWRFEELIWHEWMDRFVD